MGMEEKSEMPSEVGEAEGRKQKGTREEDEKTRGHRRGLGTLGLGARGRLKRQKEALGVAYHT